MKFILFVEGETERQSLPKFFKQWLDPRLSKPVGISPVCFHGNDKYLTEVKKRARLYLLNQDVIAVIGLLDLYGLNFPTHLSDAKERYDWAKQDIEKRINHSKFRQFFAVHELEAWALSDPTLFPAQVKNAFPSAVAKPESVNFNQPPAKLLEKLFSEKLKRPYKKVVDGNELFGRLDPNLAYQKCQRLKDLLDEMLNLAKASGH